MTHGFLNYLPGYVLPVLRIRISRRNFCCLFFRAIPRVFDVGEFVVWMEYFTCSISTCLETNSKPYQVPRQSSDDKTGVVLSDLFEAIGERILVKSIFTAIPFLLPRRLKFLKRGKCLPKGRFIFIGEVLLDSIQVLTILKADYGMC